MHSFCEGPALSNHNDVTFFDWESRRAVDWDISVSLLISVVFRNIVEIVPSDDNGLLHFGWDHNAFKDLASDWDIGGEGALLINVFRFDGFLGGFESETDILEVSDSSAGLFCQQFLAVQEHIFLFLEWSLMLSYMQFVLGCQPWLCDYHLLNY